MAGQRDHAKEVRTPSSNEAASGGALTGYRLAPWPEPEARNPGRATSQIAQGWPDPSTAPCQLLTLPFFKPP